MSNWLFISGLTGAYLPCLWWSCRHLPDEKWQIAATVPRIKDESGYWLGTNITFYGLIIAAAITTAATLFLMMMGAVGASPGDTLTLLIPLLAIAVPASRLVAGWVEKKAHTFTVAGAMACGLFLAPWLTLAVDGIMSDQGRPALGVPAVLAAMAVAYGLGEGLGRLACISFGCCYGKPLAQCPPLIQRLFTRRHFIFTGATKKAAYEGRLEGQPVLPIQALTSALYVGTSFVGLALFLNGRFVAAVWVVLLITQMWRVFSETLRADFRGDLRLTMYQRLALAAIPYGGLMAYLFPNGTTPLPDPTRGLAGLWRPEVILVLQATWFMVAWYLGRSRVTAARIQVHLTSPLGRA